MSLMFSRVARNFIKNGYFPTDEETIQRILSALSPKTDHGITRIIDPCCGEGCALAEVNHYLEGLGANPVSYGIEYDEERAWHAKQILRRCIHSDLADCNVALRSFSLLWLNPPYGDIVSDTEFSLSDKRASGRKRLEKEFYSRCIHMLQPGGILVLIVPYTVLDEGFARMISKHCRDVSVFASPEQKFRQAVIFGIKRSRPSEASKQVVMELTQAQQNRYFVKEEGVWASGFTTQCQLPEVWNKEPYIIPPADDNKDIQFSTVKIDEKQLESEVKESPVLWSRFHSIFRTQATTVRRPLRKLSPWHLSLMLAAGQVSGVVTSKTGRVLLIKGDTFKTKSIRQETSLNEDTGDITRTRIATDRFVPLIRAIDFTPNSPDYGQIIHIE